MITTSIMPRNKNPNPRQVTDEYPDVDETNGAEEDIAYPGPPEDRGMEEDKDEQAMSPQDEAEEDNIVSPEMLSELVEHCLPEQEPCSNIASTSPPSLVPFSEKGLANSLSVTKSRYGKGAAWANTNSGPLEWASKRFTLKPGGHVSASTIISMYMDEVASKQEFPVPLHNYQVGQILRRLFPNLTRCKITRNRKRMWVYKDLCPRDLTQEEIENIAVQTHQPMSSIVTNVESSSKSLLTDGRMEQTRMSSSPQSNEEDVETSVNLQTRNEILRGLLNDSNYIRAISPTSNKSDKDDCFKPKLLTSKDTEVQKWLYENYKYKEGFFVKSYDLLKRYNQGRLEMVKYLSQVGRVMKCVFPEVKHQRKSFYGGKREWVYLHLKPIDVESDSEEGKNMQLDYIRKMARTAQGAYKSNRSDITDDWRQDRVNITHMPLSMVHYHSHSPSNGISSNKQPQRTYFPSYKVKSVLGKKIVIKRENLLDETEATNDSNEVQSSSIDADKDGHLLFETKGNIAFGSRTRKSYSNQEDEDEIEDGEQWASKRLKLCASDIIKSQSDKPQVLNLSTGSGSVLYKHLSKSSKTEYENTVTLSGNKASRLDNMINILHSGRTDNNSLQRGTTFLNDNKDEQNNATNSTGTHRVIDLTLSGEKVEQNSSRHASPVMFASGSEQNQKISNPTKYFDLNDTSNYQSQDYPKVNGGFHSVLKSESDSQLNWEFLQMYNPHQFGWIKCSQTSHKRFNGGSKKNMFIEYLMVNGQWLVNGHRVIREVKIYSDWNVSIYVLGRRVYPDVLNGITDLEKSKSSLDKVFRVLSNAHICMGFHANSISDLYIHGILVSKSEVWSSREENEEEVRQRAVNCQILFNGNSNSCSKCDRINRLYNQQRISQRK